MISHIKGTIKSIDSDNSKVVVDVNGVGYEILLPTFVMRAFLDRGTEPGEEASLETYYYVTERQPRPVLIGFNNEFERRFFEKLIAVEDLGPAKAAKAFVFSVSTVANAIEDGNAELLQSMPGIGSRTAQKIVATLRERVAEFALLKDEGYATMPKATSKKDVKSEALEVLTELGYKRPEAKAKVEEIMETNPEIKEVEELIREVFRGEKG
ncbi:MAG: Holliday junction branch migration protein RuvA [Dehalococcoidia bacterium]